MDETTTPKPEGSGLSRRDMLRRSALVGGTMVWMTPAVQSLASPAFAAGTTAGGDGPCEYIAFIKFDLKTGFDDEEGTGNDTCRLTQCAGSNITVTAVGTTSATLKKDGTTVGTVTAVVGTNNCVTLDFTWLNTGCNIDESSSYFIFKDGKDTGTGGSGCEPDDSGKLTDAGITVDAGGDVYKICGNTSTGSGGTALSHINLCVCVQCPV
jgi:hypothetical protein